MDVAVHAGSAEANKRNETLSHVAKCIGARERNDRKSRDLGRTHSFPASYTPYREGRIQSDEVPKTSALLQLTK